MAIALVGSLGALQTGASPLQGAFGQATTAGNLLVGWLSQDPVGNVTNDQGWSLVESNTNVNWHMVFKANCGASETAPTFTSAGTTFQAIVLAEFSGVVTASPLENHNITGAAANTSTTTCAAADAAIGNLLIGQGEFELTKAGTDTSTVTFNNATTTAVANNDSTSAAVHYRFGYGITTTIAAAVNCTATDTSMNIGSCQAMVASFTAAAAAGAFQPRHTGTLFQDPAVLTKARDLAKDAWEKRGRIFVPRLWVPEGAVI